MEEIEISTVEFYYVFQQMNVSKLPSMSSLLIMPILVPNFKSKFILFITKFKIASLTITHVYTIYKIQI